MHGRGDRLRATGSVAEYGDPFNTMGNSGNTGHFDATQKEILGWITPSQVKTHAGGTATYTLSPIETGGLPTYAVKIPTNNANRTYWLEYRQPVGTFDAFITPATGYPNNGAQVRIEYPFEKSSGSDDTEILDMTPATAGNFHDAALLVGAAPFVDPGTQRHHQRARCDPRRERTAYRSGRDLGRCAHHHDNVEFAESVDGGRRVTFTATVTGIAPTGTVIFTDGGAAIAACGAVALVGSGNARTAGCTIASLTGGTHSIVATYSGDASNGASVSVALSQVVNKSATTTTQVSSLNPSTVGASVTFTATVTGASPTGTVNFTDGGVSLAGCSAAALTGAGNARTAACTTAALVAGTRSIVAAYAGDAGNVASTSATLSQVVNKKATTTTQVSSLNPSAPGASVTFTATVTGTSPTGTVNFTDGGTSIAGCAAVALTGAGNARTAACTTAALVAGTRSIVAAYAGDAGNLASTSTTLSQVVSKNASTTTQVSSLNPSTVGASVTFTATVTGASPTGTVNFTDGGVSLAGCSAVALTGAGNARTAACTTAALVAGTRNIVSSYAGDAGNLASTSATLSQVVNKKATTTTQVSSLNPSTVGASVTFTATVTGTSPAGTVNFTDGGVSLAGCSAVALTGAGNARTAACTTAALVAGTRSIVATYAGDAGNVASTSATLSQVVNKKVTTTTQVSSLNPSTLGAGVTFTATVTGTLPTGTVNFTDGGASIAGCAAVALTGAGNARTAACTTTALTVATHNIVAAYAGDPGNLAATSTTLSQVVAAGGGGGTSTNVALAANGGVASASSAYSAVLYPVTAVNNGDRAGLNWGNGGGWNDGTSSSYPDWVQINFSGTKTIDHVIVYTVQDNYSGPVDPSDTLTFNYYGITDFQVQSWNGSAWVTLASVAGNNLVKRQVNFAATTTDRIRVNVTGALGGYSRITEIEAWGTGGGGGGPVATTTTTASSANPSAAGASVTFTGTVVGNAPTGTVNFTDGGASIAGCSAVALAGAGNSRTATCSTSALAAGSHAIVATYGGDAGNTGSGSTSLSQAVKAASSTVVGSSANPLGLGISVTFTATVTGNAPTGAIGFSDGGTVIAGCSAVALVGSGNTRTASCTTSAMTAGIHTIGAAYGGDAGNVASSGTLVQTVNGGGQLNVALAANGGVATASSAYSALYPVTAINNGDRAGLKWGSGGGWNDGTSSSYPDWVQINFSGTRTIDHVIVYTVQDNYTNPVDPSSALTFTYYGITDFQVQSWNGSAWVTLASVAGNNLVKRQVNFAATTTDRIRVNVTGALGGYSRITELEAWGN